MPRQKKQQKWGICVQHPYDQCGWLVGGDMEVLTFPSPDEAAKALKQMKRNKRYSWNQPIEIKEFTGLPDEEE